MAKLQLQCRQASSTSVLDTRRKVPIVRGGQYGRDNPYANLPKTFVRRDEKASFSPDVRTFDNKMQGLLQDLERLSHTLWDNGTEEMEVNYDYMTRAAAEAQKAPDVVLTDDEKKAYVGLGEFTYTLDDDY